MEKDHNNNLTLLSGSLLFLAILFGINLSSNLITSAESVSKTATVRVADACSLEVDSLTAHTATLMNGIYSGTVSEYASGIGTTNLLATCNDAGGFSIYAVGFSDDEFGNTNLVPSDGSNNNIVTGTATSGATSNWAMKLTAGTGTDVVSLTTGYNTFHDIPSTYTKVATKNSATTTTTGAALTTTYATYISLTQPAGAYNGQVKYTLVHPATEVPLQPQVTEAGCIRYYANGSNVLGTMGCQTVSSSATSVTLLASNFSRQGYGFAGWSDVYDYETNPNAHFYGPQEDITFTAGQYTGSNPGLSLYAVWIKSEGNLQDTAKVSTLCGTGTGSLTMVDEATNILSQSITALSDARDNNTYAIAKLADGKCWMIENLRLESTASHNTDGTLAQGYGTSTTYGNFSGLADAESTGFSSTYTANSLYYSGTQEGTASINIGTSSYPAAYRMPRYNNWNNQSTSANRPQNPTTNDATNSTTNAGMYSYGNYYTWHAAIADTTYYSSGDHGTTSLCPTGWRLPIGDQSTADRSFGALSVALGGPTGGATADSSSTPTGTVMSGAFRSFPNNFLYSGYFNSSSAYVRGSYGIYWSSTARSIYGSFYLYLRSFNVVPGTSYYDKYYGYSIRCVVAQ